LLTQKFNEFKRLYVTPKSLPSKYNVPKDAVDWSSWCGVAVRTFSQWIGWQKWPDAPFGTATIAGNNSGPLNNNFNLAPIGAYHFWGGGPLGHGHVVIDLEGGGHTVGQSFNTLNISSVSNMTKTLERSGHFYRGWSRNYAGGTLIPSSSTAGGDVKPLPNNKEIDMLPVMLHTPATNKTIIVFAEANKILQLTDDAGLRDLAISMYSPVLYMQQPENVWAARLQMLGFAEVASNPELINSVPRLGYYLQGTVDSATIVNTIKQAIKDSPLVDVDESAIAELLGPKLVESLTPKFDALEIDYTEVAKFVNDEDDRRERERLSL